MDAWEEGVRRVAHLLRRRGHHVIPAADTEIWPKPVDRSGVLGTLVMDRFRLTVVCHDILYTPEENVARVPVQAVRVSPDGRQHDEVAAIGPTMLGCSMYIHIFGRGGPAWVSLGGVTRKTLRDCYKEGVAKLDKHQGIHTVLIPGLLLMQAPCAWQLPDDGR